MRIIDDEFNISNYIKGDTSDTIDTVTDANVDIAIKWSIDSIRVIILPTNNLIDLENQWVKFNQMIKKNRRESDWKSLELFGMTNQDHYDKIKSSILKMDIDSGLDDFMNESYVMLNPADSYYNFDSINYTTEDVSKARTWAKESDRFIILPTRTLNELESLWDSYNSMIKKHKRESDWMSSEIFGISNMHHYEYLKSQFIKDDIGRSDVEDYGSFIEGVTVSDSIRYFNNVAKNESVSNIVKSLLEMTVQNHTIYEEVITNNIISSTINDFECLTGSNDSDVNYGDLPYFSPEEMLGMGVFSDNPADNFYGVLADNNDICNISSKTWFENYKWAYNGFETDLSIMNSDWVNKVSELTFNLKSIVELNDDNAIRSRKQSILELGWNPEIEFNCKNRCKVKEMTMYKMNIPRYNKIINLESFTSSSNPRTILEQSKSNIHPVYVVLTEGSTVISSAIKTKTRSIYSHVSISLDSTLENMYSFGINDNGLKGGFRKETIKDLDDNSKIRVYAFFVDSESYKKLTDMLDNLKDNIKKTTYSYSNLFTYLFNIPYNKDWSLVCSQFVDRCLKLVDMDISGKDSSLVPPSEIDDGMKKSNKIYSIFYGMVKNYNSSRMNKLVDALISKTPALTEHCEIYYENEAMFITSIITNINNISALYEMKNHMDIVKNSTTKSILENILFDSINIIPYTRFTLKNETTSLKSVTNLIEKFVESI